MDFFCSQSDKDMLPLQMLQSGLAGFSESAAGWLACITLRQGLGTATPAALSPNPTAAVAAVEAARAQLARDPLLAGTLGKQGQMDSALLLLEAWAQLEQGDTDLARDGFLKLIGMYDLTQFSYRN